MVGGKNSREGMDALVFTLDYVKPSFSRAVRRITVAVN